MKGGSIHGRIQSGENAELHRHVKSPSVGQVRHCSRGRKRKLTSSRFYTDTGGDTLAAKFTLLLRSRR